MGQHPTHFDSEGRARMVDVSDKPATAREATARGRVRMSAQALSAAMADNAKKGDVRATAEIAGMMAGKRTSELIPLCHPIALSNLRVEVSPDRTLSALIVTATAKAMGQTGVEMEALTAVSVACLTIYDMLKAIDRAMVIEDIAVVSKSGGASGDYHAP